MSRNSQEFRDSSNRLSAWIEAPESFDELRFQPASIPKSLDDAADFRPRPLFFGELVGVALLNGDGQVVEASELFMRERGVEHIDLDRARTAMRSGSMVLDVSARGLEADRQTLYAYVPRQDARGLAVPEPIAEYLQAEADAELVLMATVGVATEPLRHVAAAYGLTPMEQRLAVRLVESGRIADAAARADMTYATARKALKNV